MSSSFKIKTHKITGHPNHNHQWQLHRVTNRKWYHVIISIFILYKSIFYVTWFNILITGCLRKKVFFYCLYPITAPINNVDTPYKYYYHCYSHSLSSLLRSKLDQEGIYFWPGDIEKWFVSHCCIFFVSSPTHLLILMRGASQKIMSLPPLMYRYL